MEQCERGKETYRIEKRRKENRNAGTGRDLEWEAIKEDREEK
jgi:hypothetical protein